MSTYTPDQSLFSKDFLDNSLSFGNSIINTLKQVIDDGDNKLNSRFESSDDIHHLIYDRAWLIDQVLVQAWQHSGLNEVESCALIAVGGYGRGELHPKSDIDVLILFDAEQPETHQQAIEQFLTLLWDLNLNIGHSVRTITECQEEAQKDITVTTNLMEARTISGNEHILHKMASLTGPSFIWDSKAFFKAKWEEQQQRHRKFNNIEYNLEPNLKASPGGLRDIQTIMWITKRQYGANSMDELVRLSVLNDEELDMLQRGQEFLWRIRYALHMIAGRPEDRLLFDHQRKIAELFGYQDNGGRLAVEQLMQKYYRTVLQLGELNDVIIQHFNETILMADEPDEIVDLNERFHIRNSFIEVKHPKVFAEQPSAMLEIFLLMARTNGVKGARATTIRDLRNHRHLIDDNFRADPINTSIFMALMRTPTRLVTQLWRMRKWGILGRYLPEFAGITGQMQHDLFHIYTVDAHTLQVVRNMRRFRFADNKDQYPMASRLIHEIPKVELCYIAGLYHDIAKGRGGDHSELGAVDARKFCERHELNKWETDLVSWLVENHLLMSMTAQRKDISDPDVIMEFAQKVQDKNHLDYLFLLTVADINATNPTLWNSWRASLMRQLYTETWRALRRGLENPINPQEYLKDREDSVLELMLDMPYTEAQIRELLGQLGQDYVFRNTPTEISWHVSSILAHKNPAQPLIELRETTDREHEGGTEIFVYTRDEPHLFAVTASVMENLNLNIQDAQIIISDNGFTLNSFIVLDDSGSPIGEHSLRIEEIKASLIVALQDPSNYLELISKRTPRQLKQFKMPTEVIIHNDAIKQVTVVEVTAPDRPGVLAMIGRVFVDFDVRLQNAKIATLGEKIDDIFYLTDEDNNPISDPDICIQLQQTLCTTLDEHSQN
ncbi:[protein-PII] uridylyltransferase [Litoribrevibacter euphylliae]|uniref:Bifunctional uridylyltransferase/uridylyl-removing enzyme n=1 Tax=Litoribrevibacter euphylliae TaxID=1834034 RepID=A0ABV7HEB8_9GAMM